MRIRFAIAFASFFALLSSPQGAFAGIIYDPDEVVTKTIYALDDVVTTTSYGRDGRVIGWFELINRSSDPDQFEIGDYRLRATLEAIVVDGIEIFEREVLYEWFSRDVNNDASANVNPSTGLVDLFFSKDLPLEPYDSTHHVDLALAFNLHDYDVLTNSYPLLPFSSSYWEEIHQNFTTKHGGNVLSGSILRGATTVPEPASVSLLALGLLLLVASRRRVR